jgi:hypothetical protein
VLLLLGAVSHTHTHTHTRFCVFVQAEREDYRFVCNKVEDFDMIIFYTVNTVMSDVKNITKYNSVASIVNSKLVAF